MLPSHFMMGARSGNVALSVHATKCSAMQARPCNRCRLTHSGAEMFKRGLFLMVASLPVHKLAKEVQEFTFVGTRLGRPGRTSTRAWQQWGKVDGFSLTAAYDVWTAEHPAPVAFYRGQSTSKENVMARAVTIQAILSIDSAKLLELVKTDSDVLFAGSEDKIRANFAALQSKLGNRRAAIDMVQLQPSLLAAEDYEISGKTAAWLQPAAQLSAISRGVLAAVRPAPEVKSRTQSMDGAIFDEIGFLLRESFAGGPRILLGPAVLPIAFALGKISELLGPSGGTSAQ